MFHYSTEVASRILIDDIESAEDWQKATKEPSDEIICNKWIEDIRKLWNNNYSWDEICQKVKDKDAGDWWKVGVEAHRQELDKAVEDCGYNDDDYRC